MIGEVYVKEFFEVISKRFNIDFKNYVITRLVEKRSITPLGEAEGFANFSPGKVFAIYDLKSMKEGDKEIYLIKYDDSILLVNKKTKGVISVSDLSSEWCPDIEESKIISDSIKMLDN